jgi:bifunctional DNA primase/polymerase-like protein
MWAGGDASDKHRTGNRQLMLTSVQDAARAAYAAGISVVPPREDGSKAPIGEWKRFQTVRATPEHLDEWYGSRTGLGGVPGKVSGNLEALEFDDHAVYVDFLELAQRALGPVIEKLESGYVEDTPSGGVHYLYRCETIAGNTKLATGPKLHSNDKIKVKIETRGEGGFIILAPSNGKVHPSGKAYRLRAGGFSTIPTLTPDERHDLHQLARAFHERVGEWYTQASED